MGKTSLRIEMPPTMVENMELLASATGMSMEALALQAMREFIARQAWRVAEIQQNFYKEHPGVAATQADIQAAFLQRWGSHGKE